MEDEDILANAPENATHVDAAENYYVNDVCDWELIDARKGNALIYQDISISNFESMHSLSDIRELVELRKEVERLKAELLPNETGTNEYGLDVAYFRKTINRELNRDISRFKPDEIARVLARLSVAADKSVIYEPEFNGAHNLEQQAIGVEEFFESNEPHISMGRAAIWKVDDVIVDEYLADLRQKASQSGCNHKFVSADNEVVTGGEICTLCHTVQAKELSK